LERRQLAGTRRFKSSSQFWTTTMLVGAAAGPRSASLISDGPWKEGTEQPGVVWVPSIAVTGGTFYTGDTFPGWRRSFFVGGLRQGESPRTGHMERIEFNDRWEEIRREPTGVG
jgi:glucose/arabinose dehydrogenase